jgi:GntR family transcriptional regulator
MSLALQELKPDAESVTPLYLQLAHKLSERISSGIWQPDEALPSERMLSETLEISRVTARKAIDVLCERGLLIRKRGSGTYITPKLEQPLSRLTNFSEELKQRGFRPGSKWLLRELGPATADEALALGLSPSSEVSRLKRLRMADDVVMAIEITTIPSRFLSNPLAVRDTLYGYFDANNIRPVHARQHLRAVNATPEQASLAKIVEGDAMMHITRIGYLEDGTAVELTHSYCRSSYYDFVVELRR